MPGTRFYGASYFGSAGQVWDGTTALGNNFATAAFGYDIASGRDVGFGFPNKYINYDQYTPTVDDGGVALVAWALGAGTFFTPDGANFPTVSGSVNSVSAATTNLFNGNPTLMVPTIVNQHPSATPLGGAKFTYITNVVTYNLVPDVADTLVVW